MSHRFALPCMLLAAACTPAEPPAELIVDFTAFELETPHAGWDGWTTPPPTIREWHRIRGERRADRAWEPVDHIAQWGAAARAQLVAADGTAVALVSETRGALTVLVGANGVIEPGTYELVVRAQGHEARLPGVTVHAHGQVQSFEPGLLADRIYPLTLGEDALGGQLFHQVPPLYVRVRPVADGLAQLDLWAEADAAPLCRVWRGDVGLSDAGRVTARLDEITTGGRTAITFTNVQLSAGLSADGAELAGLKLGATVDASQLDRVLTNNSGAPLEEGDACVVLDFLGLPCGVCAGSSLPNCVDYQIWNTAGVGIPEHEALARAGASALGSFDAASPCAGPGPASVTACSTLGPAGVGVWVLALGVPLFRRRRRANLTPSDREST